MMLLLDMASLSTAWSMALSHFAGQKDVHHVQLVSFNGEAQRPAVKFVRWQA